MEIVSQGQSNGTVISFGRGPIISQDGRYVAFHVDDGNDAAVYDRELRTYFIVQCNEDEFIWLSETGRYFACEDETHDEQGFLQMYDVASQELVWNSLTGYRSDGLVSDNPDENGRFLLMRDETQSTQMLDLEQPVVWRGDRA